MAKTIGIDIGATKTGFVLFSRGRKKSYWKIPTPKKDLPEVLAKEASKNGRLDGVGIGAPGPLDKERKVLLNPPNLKGVFRLPLAEILQKKLKTKVKMENDANCFALGEALKGAGRGKRTVFGITLGSGVGGGIVMEGKIYRGSFGSAGEIGHVPLQLQGLKCGCGNRGCLEAYLSQEFFLRKGVVPLELQKKAARGEKKALALYKEYGKILGAGLSVVTNLLDPDIIVVGGGISNAYRFFAKEAEKEMRKRTISLISKKKIKIKKAELGDSGGAVGAALLI